MNPVQTTDSNDARGGAGAAGDPAMAIEMEAVSIRFDGRQVLDRFSFQLSRGESATLIGRSGCGKSTVLNALMGFVETEQGSIAIFGEPLTPASVWTLRQSMALVTQEPVMGSGTVSSLLDRPFRFSANAHLESNRSRIPELFDRFLLPAHLLDKEITLLSGGEKQRVAIITALLLDRPIVLLDEASSALDPDSRSAVAGYFRTRSDLTLLSVSHDTEGFRLSDRIIDLSDGRGEGA